MMRSMFSGVSSLRVHQTRMDVIANNIANVNTTGFKSQRAGFTDSFYQRVMGASGPSAQTGRAGTNPQQIGLGVSMGSIDNIMTQGASLRTDIATDVMIQGNGFFIVGDATGQYFTRAGNINEDFMGNLHINGMQLMGWSTRVEDGRHVVDRSALVPLQLSNEKRTMPAEPTTLIDMIGNLNNAQLDPMGGTDQNGNPFMGVIRTMQIFDTAGNFYSVDIRFIKHDVVENPPGTAFNDPANSYWTFEYMTEEVPGSTATPPERAVAAWFNGDRGTTTNPKEPALIAINMIGSMAANNTNDPRVDFQSYGTIAFDDRGNFIGIGVPSEAQAGSMRDLVGVPNSPPSATGTPLAGGLVPRAFLPAGMYTDQNNPGANGTWFSGTNFLKQIVPIPSQGFTPPAGLGEGGGITYDPAGATVYTAGTIRMNAIGFRNNGGMNTNLQTLKQNGGGPGELMEIGIGGDGTITGRYSNDTVRTLGQIPVAVFRNPAGLERAGANLWAASANSGMFDGIGQVGNMMGGTLEGSNVDLAGQFTDMITTQRGFQAASRTISVSDEMLQELVNLKR